MRPRDAGVAEQAALWPGARVERVVYCTARIKGAANPEGAADQDVYLKVTCGGQFRRPAAGCRSGWSTRAAGTRQATCRMSRRQGRVGTGGVPCIPLTSSATNCPIRSAGTVGPRAGRGIASA